MNKQAFHEELQRVLSDNLLSEIDAHVEQWYDSRQQIVQYISALEKKEQNFRESLSSTLRALQKLLAEESAKQLTQKYQSAVDEVAEQFPANIKWQQGKERFVVQDGDSLYVAMAKRVKHAVQSVPENWQQAVPLQGIVRYHLLEADIIVGWHQQLQRIQLQMISEVEDQLVARTSAEEEIMVEEWVALAEKLEKKLKEGKEQVTQTVADDIDRLESEIKEAAERTGTIERRSAYYREARIGYRSKEVDQKLQSQGDSWSQAQKLLYGRTELISEFYNLHQDIVDRCSTFSDDLQSYFADVIINPLNELQELLQGDKQETSAKQVSQLKPKLMKLVDEQMSNRLRKEIEQQVFARKVEHFFDDLLLRANQTSQQGTLLYDIDLQENPPKLDHQSIDWRLLVVRSIREQVVNAVEPLKEQYAEFISELLEDIHDISSVIDVNLDSAIPVEENSQKEQKAEAQEAASEALQRLNKIVEDIQSRSVEKHREIMNTIAEGHTSFTQLLLGIVHEGDRNELQLLNAKYKAKETTKGWQTVVQSRMARVQDQLALWSRFGWRKIKTVVETVALFLGFMKKEIQETKRADIATYLSDTDQKMRELPYIYQRLFNFDAVADQRFYVQLLDSSGIIKKAYEKWQQSFPATLAVVGEKGSGKSTFLNLTIESEITGSKTIHITLQDTIWSEQQLVELLADELDISGVKSIQEIVEKITGWSDHKVVCIENIQNCFVRNLNGYEAIEKFCYLISETKNQVFWIASCSRYAWRFLDKTVQLSEYFSHFTTTDVLDATQIKRVILNRHRSSGYTLHFEADNETTKSRSYLKLMDDEDKEQKYLQEDYFEKLTELAEGNASVAMIFWIRSIRKFDDRCCYIQPLEVTSLEMIEDLNPQVLFTLAAFVLHDTLTDEQLSMVSHTTKEKSRLMINRLQSRGLLVEKEGMYAINHLMYRQIIRVLKERNIIHLV
ncbi:hypothetical protein [Fodinibius halophilus]|uniref:ATP-binding protein n=1 Tax=Fodinibius halophilus TaxID=1736908 RepID=A0A6M1SXQ1_9BACT|nr:hypothetical protein [Fodinibius halophilus]NGP88186.1 hypothetical protein [Fodinibius halophilus]